jgi:hypothetical protein
VAEASDAARLKTKRLRRIQKTLINNQNAVPREWAVGEAGDRVAAWVGSEPS